MRGFGQNRSGRWRGCSLSDESKDYGKSLWERLSRINMEHMPTGIDTMSLIIADNELENNLDEILDRIRGKVNPDLIYIYRNISLIAIVGHGMSNQLGTAAKVFSALANANINVKMIDQGSSEINIIVGVNADDMNRAISAIYHAFF